MKYYPVNLDVREKKCLVAGGGRVGLRKARTLAECGARVTVVSLAFDPGFGRLETVVTLVPRAYSASDLDGMFLVLAATDNREVNQKVQQDAAGKGVLCNIADDPDSSTFTLPSIVRRGDLMLTVSTAGKSPALAKSVRRELEDRFGPEYGDFLTVMGALRNRLLRDRHAPDAHREIFRQIVESDLLHLLKNNNIHAANSLLSRITGTDVAMESLLAERIQ